MLITVPLLGSSFCCPPGSLKVPCQILGVNDAGIAVGPPQDPGSLPESLFTEQPLKEKQGSPGTQLLLLAGPRQQTGWGIPGLCTTGSSAGTTGGPALSAP